MRLFQHNVGEKILAAVLAVLLFWTVEQAQAPEQQTVFGKELSYLGLPEKMRVVGDHPAISITARGNPEALERLARFGVDKVWVFVDLTNAMRGTATYPVFLSAPPDLLEELNWNVSPKQVDLTLAGSSDVRVRIEAAPIKPPPTGFDPTAWQAEPEYVLVSGDERDVQEVARARVLYDPTEKLSPGEMRDIQLLDDRSMVLESDFVKSPPKARLVPSATTPVTKLVPVAPQWRGNLPSGYKLSGYRIEPGEVAVQGLSVLLDAISQLRTEPIDLTGLTGDRSVVAPLLAPEGVELRRNSQVTIRLHITPTEESR